MDKYDLHVHTEYSGDSLCEIGKIIEVGRKKGLSGIAITDHDTMEGLEEALKITEDINFLVMPGIEISSADGHILGLGIKNPIPPDLPAKKTVDLIRRENGIAIAAHPFCLDPKPFCPLRAEFDAIEIFNPRRYIGNHIAKNYADQSGIPPFAGSDAHSYEEIGLAGIETKCKSDVNKILKEIKLGKVSVFGRTLPIWSYLRRIPYKISISL